MPTRLDPDQIGETIERLCQRIEARFPASGLSGVARDLSEIAGLTKERIA
jgi:hypothetical protein